MPQCPHQALQIVDGKVLWNAVVCEQCDTCLKMCPQHATPMAQSMSVDEVLSHIRKAVLFIEGITVSGGEATTSCRLWWRCLQPSKTIRNCATSPASWTVTVC